MDKKPRARDLKSVLANAFLLEHNRPNHFMDTARDHTTEGEAIRMALNSEKSRDDIDGLEELTSDGQGSGLEAERPEEGVIKAPFDPAKIDVITQARTIDLLLTRLREGELDLSPDFQRRSLIQLLFNRIARDPHAILRLHAPA